MTYKPDSDASTVLIDNSGAAPQASMGWPILDIEDRFSSSDGLYGPMVALVEATGLQDLCVEGGDPVWMVYANRTELYANCGRVATYTRASTNYGLSDGVWARHCDGAGRVYMIGNIDTNDIKIRVVRTDGTSSIATINLESVFRPLLTSAYDSYALEYTSQGTALPQETGVLLHVQANFAPASPGPAWRFPRFYVYVDETLAASAFWCDPDDGPFIGSPIVHLPNGVVVGYKDELFGAVKRARVTRAGATSSITDGAWNTTLGSGLSRWITSTDGDSYFWAYEPYTTALSHFGGYKLKVLRLSDLADVTPAWATTFNYFPGDGFDPDQGAYYDFKFVISPTGHRIGIYENYYPDPSYWRVYDDSHTLLLEAQIPNAQVGAAFSVDQYAIDAAWSGQIEHSDEWQHTTDNRLTCMGGMVRGSVSAPQYGVHKLSLDSILSARLLTPSRITSGGSSGAMQDHFVRGQWSHFTYSDWV